MPVAPVRLFLSLCLFTVLMACSDRDEPAADASGPVEAQTPASATTEDGAEGDVAVEDAESESVSAPLPAVTSGEFGVLNIQEKSRNLASGTSRNVLSVILSEPLDASQDFRPFISLTQLPDTRYNPARGEVQLIQADWVLDANQRELYLPVPEANTRFRVQVFDGLPAASGKTLASGVSKELYTRPVNASVSFESSGSFLPADMSRGLPITAVNVDKVDVAFHRVRPDRYHEFFQRVQDRYYRYNVYGFDQFTDLAYSGQFAVEAADNTRKSSVLPIDSISELKQPGIYVAVMSIAGQLAYDKEITYYSVTDIGLHVRQYQGRMDVHVASLKTGKPIPTVDITLLDDKGERIDQGMSSPSGVAQFALGSPAPAIILARKGSSLTALTMQTPALDLSSFDLGERPSRQSELFLYSERDLYRPGETATISALLRDRDGQPVDIAPLNVQVFNATGKRVDQFVWHQRAEQGGYYGYELSIPRTAATGDWQFRVTGPNIGTVSYSLKVEDFLPERMTLEFDAAQEIFAPGDELLVTVQGDYLYGAPAAGNRLESAVRISHARSPIEAFDDFEFGDIRDTQPLQRYELNDLMLDADGSGQLRPLASNPLAGQLRSPLQVTITGSLFESGGRPVTRRFSGTIVPNTELVGIRTGFGEDNPRENSELQFDLIKSTLSGEAVAVDDLEVSLIREDRQYFWEYSSGQGWHYQITESEYAVETDVISLDGSGPASLKLPVEWGHYRLEVRDPVTDLISSVRFHAGYDWYRYWQESRNGGQAARPDEVSMALDQGAYSAGDTARVHVVPPSAGEAIILVEADTLLWSSRASIPAEGATIEIPVGDWSRHDIYITAVVMQPGEARNRVTPDRSVGLIHLPMDRTERRLALEWLDAEDSMRPQTTLTQRIRLADASGKALSGAAWVTLAAVDVGVTNITDFQTPDPFEAFFGQRRYSVDSRDMYGRIIELNDFDTASLRFGGDADLSRGGMQPVTDVQIVSLFDGPVEIDAEGIAQFDLEVPYFGGRLKLMAVAWSATQFGSAEREVTVVSPMVTQLSMPRFLASGDTTTLALDLHNKSGSQQDVTVSLTVGDLLQSEAGDQQLTLADDDKQTLYYPVTALGAFGGETVRIRVDGAGIDSVSREWTLGIRPAFPANTFQTMEVLAPGQELGWLEEFSDTVARTRHGSMSLSGFAEMNLKNHFGSLLGYPYGCLEQTSSKMLPLLYADRQVQQDFGLQTLTDGERRNRVQTGLARLAQMQTPQGGFSLWGDSRFEDQWLSAYVTEILSLARNKGYTVPDAVLDAAVGRLTSYVSQRVSTAQLRYTEQPDHYVFAYQAYAAYVLSLTQQVNLNQLRLLSKDADQAMAPLPLVHLALALRQAGDQARSETLLSQAFETQRSEAYLGDYGSRVRDTAWMIHLLADAGLEPSRVATLQLDLATALKRRRYLSTQDHVSLFLAGMATRSFIGEAFSAETRIAGQTEAIEQADPLRLTLRPEDLGQQIRVRSTGKDPLFVTLAVNGYPLTAPPAVNEGLRIQRQFYKIEGSTMTAIERLETAYTGELFLVHLRVTADERTPDALVADLMAAGFELENQNLENSVQLAEFQLDGKRLADLMQMTVLKHQEYRDDRYVAAVDLQPKQPTHLFYLMRAVTPGDYRMPSAFVEDMYEPSIRSIGEPQPPVTVTNRR